MTRTRRKLAGVNIGKRHHGWLVECAELDRDTVFGTVRAQTEMAIEAWAEKRGLFADAGTPETPDEVLDRIADDIDAVREDECPRIANSMCNGVRDARDS